MSAYDGKAYRRGWDAGQRGSEGALDRADDRREPAQWYDGYHDAAAGREKWHLRDCTGCPDHPAEQAETQECTGCGVEKPLTEYGRTSAARGNKPMRRCKACIRAEALARREARRASESHESQGETTAKVKGQGNTQAKTRKGTKKTAA